jgi:photosystem II stability/assembly factor-like uncharacterized protein
VRRLLGLALGLFTLGAPLPATAETILVEAGSSMSYLANTSDPGVDTTWFLPGFVEGTAWSTGIYGVGHEGQPPGEPLAHDLLETEIPGPVDSIYTRTTFTLADADDVFSVFFGVDYDDGAVVWVNGVEVYRTPEMRAWTLAWDTVSSPHESSNGTEPEYTPLRDISEAAIPALQDGDNLLAVGIWNNTGLSEDLVLVPKLLINRSMRRGPYLQQATSDSVVVRWRTGAPGGSRVLFGTDPGSLTSDVSLGGSRTDHELTLGGLEPNTRYYYAVGTLGEILAGGDADHFFVTPPGAGTPKPTRIWVLGDPGTGNTNAMNVRDAYYDFTDDLAHGGADARNTDLFLMLGDNADPQGTQQDYQENVFEIYARSLRQSVLWPAIGNHDLFHDDTQTWPYYDIFTLPSQGEAGGVVSGTEEYYSYDYGNIHFVVLNSVQTTMVGFGDDMLAWLTADLQDATEDWIIAYWHHPPFSKGSHDSDDPTDSHGRLIWMRENALPVLEDHGVDLVLSGHSHSYERSYLIDGHYGDSSTFVESMKKDPGDGDENGDGAYVKPYRGEVPYQGEGDGAVYAVAGCSSHLSPGKAEDLGGTEPNHPAMVVTMLELGSVVLDVDGNRLDLTLLSDTGDFLDRFTIFKGAETLPPQAAFEAAPRAGQAPFSVSFTDLTLNGPTVWSWDLDDDGLTDSTEPAPILELTQPGLRAVRLAVANSAGSDEELKSDYICVTAGTPGALTGLDFAANRDVFFWNAGVNATAYDAVRGDLGALVAGDLSSVDLTCLEDDDDDLQATDPTLPEPGQALFYLAGAANCAGEQGTYDASGPGAAVPRDGLLQPVCATCAMGADDDGDGICAGDDNCPGVANPGQQDGDGDGAGDDCDGCPADPGKTDPGLCGCGVADTDSDGDLTPDCDDGCPADPDKIDPGQCGCGVADTDSDGDLTADCNDGCPDDPFKVDPGYCGCGEPDTDTDQDGTPNCVDGCPDDPNKIEPGVCGCGQPDVDSDLDGLLDCEDGCPFDPDKIEPGYCGCGEDECWITLPPVTGEDLESVDFPVDAMTGYAAGSSGTILKTVNGGIRWDPLNSRTFEDLETIMFPDDTKIGYVVGNAGTILKTTDGGQNWEPLDSGTTVKLRGVYFVPGTSIGYVVGGGGTILKTTDRGETWQSQDSGTFQILESVHFPTDPWTGYIVGRNGTILKTTTAGSGWVHQGAPTDKDLEDVCFPENDLTGYIVGDDATMLKTYSGGSFWFAQNPGTPRTLRGISFPGFSLVGYVVGNSGVIRKTVDGGEHWLPQGAAFNATLRDVQFPVFETGYIVGSNGVILKWVEE